MDNYIENSSMDKSKKQFIELKPRLGGFLASYIIFSLPGFIISLLWLLIFILIIIGFISGLAASGQNSRLTLNFRELRDGDKKNTILVYDLNGPITTGSLTNVIDRESSVSTKLVEEDFRAIKEIDDIKTVVFRVNTPGGEAAASKVLGDLIGDLRNFYRQNEVVFYFDRLSASGGLITAYKNPNYIVGSPYGETGSIGVFLTLPNFEGTAEKIGYSQTVIKSSEFKDIGNPFRQPTQPELDYFQSQVDREFSEFKDTVSKGRNLESSQVDALATGFTYINKEAQEKGLIDEVGNLDVAVSKASEKASLGSDYRVIEIENEIGLFDNFVARNQTVANLFSLPQVTKDVVDRTTFFKSGTMYMIDEYKF